MRKLLLVFFGFFSLLTFGQTKLIAHKSHSGSLSDFRKALDGALFDVWDSNLGEAPQRRVQYAKLDSVIYISPQKAVMVTSEYCKVEEVYQPELSGAESLWKKGRDTVVQHPLFSKHHALDSIKEVLKQDYYFKNNIDSVVFIGFDNVTPKQDKPNKKQTTPPFLSQDHNFPPGMPLIVVVIALGSISILMIWKVKAFSRSALYEK